MLELCWGDDGALQLERFETRHEPVGVADVTVTDRCGAIDLCGRESGARAGLRR
ncbi:MAG: hypothetical protein R2704_09585 [Microthrixaceae bacterium]